ncbi:hypothetical protein [Iodidimonas sp. SYSU 1G8]|uniref:hypothetical protein n=1 Tax=Iodidimonas sp. SYSU 1G8 TaxID=3133967 RepID=UPI0031FE5076
MTPYHGIMGHVFRWPWFAEARKRRFLFGAAAVVLAVLTVFPRPYKAYVTLTPADQTTGGLAAAAGTVGAFAGLIGSQQVVDVLLKLSRGVQVREEVIKQLNLSDRWDTENTSYMMRRLDRIVTLRALRGSMVQIEAKTHDPQFALQLVQVYSDVIRAQAGQLIRDQTAFKREVLRNRFIEASERKDKAEADLAEFGKKYGLPAPDGALSTAADRVPGLRNLLRDKQSQLEVMRQFQTNNSYQVQTIQAEIAELERLITFYTASTADRYQSVDWTIERRKEFEDLLRELEYSLDLYKTYKRLIDGTTFEDLVSNGNLRIIERPYLDPGYQLNLIPLSLLALTLAIAAAMEFNLFNPKAGLRESRDHATN